MNGAETFEAVMHISMSLEAACCRGSSESCTACCRGSSESPVSPAGVYDQSGIGSALLHLQSCSTETESSVAQSSVAQEGQRLASCFR